MTDAQRRYNKTLKYKATTRRYRHRVKEIVLTRYGRGGKLLCCWPGCRVTDIDMLTIDHINDDGATKKKSGLHPRTTPMYLWLRYHKYPKGFQTLCWNHQWKKRIEGLRKRREASNK